MIYVDIYLRKLVDNICYFHEKQPLQLLSCYEFLLFYLEITHNPNQI